ncbi:uncharacterized protein LOC143040171 [Oratosquilla oratoria]|uniref:uncharacterized protein LOC143040171 n=1 Tax=Oratosquilla oratoria TaxID=337810 RepID=UPI003F775FC2
MDYRKSVTCRYWKKGSCLKGEKCHFLHGFSTKAMKQRKRKASRNQDLVQETHMNDKTQPDEVLKQVEDSGDQRFDEKEEYNDHCEGISEDTIAALLGGSSTLGVSTIASLLGVSSNLGEGAQSNEVKKGKPKRKYWRGPKRKKHLCGQKYSNLGQNDNRRPDRMRHKSTSESTGSDYPGSCSQSSSSNENHLSKNVFKELSTISHSKQPTCSKSEGQSQDKTSVSKVDLQLFEKRILSNCQELLASLRNPNKLVEVLKLQDQQISAELCKGSLTSSMVPHTKDTSIKLISSPTKGEKNSYEKSRSANEDHNNSLANTYDNIKIVVDCKKTEETIDETTDKTRQVVLVEGGKSAESDITEKDSEQNKHIQNLDSEESKKSGSGFQRNSDASECDTSVSEEVSCQAKKRPRGCNKQESLFRVEDDNNETMIKQVSQELDDQAKKRPRGCNKQESLFRVEDDNNESMIKQVSQELDDVLEALKEIVDSSDSDEESE